MDAIKLKNEMLELTFAPEGGGFPTNIRVREFDNRLTEFIANDGPMLSLMCGEQQLVPFLDDKSPVNEYSRDGAQILEFPNIRWKTAGPEGSEMKNMFLALKWELFPDGVSFCDMFFYYATLDVPEIKDFHLSVPLDFSDFNDVRWSVCGFPAGIDGAIIQTAAPERFIQNNSSREYQELFTFVNFNAMRENAPTLFAEFFLEGNNSLFNCPPVNAASSIQVNSAASGLEWNFQSVAQSGKRRPLHWRNRWGFKIKPAACKRNLPPLAMYHYLDNFQRIPDEEQIREIAAAGAEVLIMHDCWRLDTQNGGIPYDEARIKKLVKTAHELGLRLAFYVRGNEQSVREDSASWFDNWLRKDLDGLYMDYGGPLGFFAAPDENSPGGRIQFREYYQCMRKLRERVGENGIFLAHTGPGYSGLAMDFFDSYVSGEGERGIMVKGRREHEYFTMSPVLPGSMWTAAFPEYSSPVMTPFLAATGQAPHIPLGVQIISSSLSHPPVPGISDLNFRELLYCWSLLDKGNGYEFFTDYNSSGVFLESLDENTARCLILSPDKRSGVIFIANLSDSPTKASFEFNTTVGSYNNYAIPGQGAIEGEIELAAYEFRAALIADSDELAADIIAKHPCRAVSRGELAEKYLAGIEKQKEYRYPSSSCRDCQLRVFMPSRMTSHEQSLWDDLYNVDISLRLRFRDGSVKTLGYVGKNGLLEKLPGKDDQIQPGDRSEPIDLVKLLGSGKHQLELYSAQGKNPFYSFLSAELTVDGEQKNILFENQLEEDRAIVHWTVKISD